MQGIERGNRPQYDQQSMTGEREPLSGPDNAWRRMGRADNLMTITGVLSFDERVTYEELCDRLEERLLRFDRFKQHIGGRKRRLRQPYWETIENFDIRTHVYHVALPEPQDKATFQRFVSNLMSRPLDERRPLWEAYLVEGAGEGEGNAVAFRINHSLGDGFALLYVLLGLADDPNSIELPIGSIPKMDDIEPANEASAEEPSEPAAAEASADGGQTATVESPGGSGLLGPVGTAVDAVTTGYRLLTQEDETETSLLGDLGTAKRAAWTGEIDLDRVKAIGDAHDATVNDVLLAATAGALRRVLEARGEDVEGLELRSTVPVNLKPMEDRTESLGNYFGLVFVPLPVGTRDFGERIRIVNERMSERKGGIEAFLMYLTLSLGGHAPEVVQEKLMEMFENQATGIVTNVPGPLDSFEFAGTEVTDVMFWVPQASDQGLGISIFSYDGDVRVGVAGDARLVEDPERITEGFEAEIDVQDDAIE